MIWAIEGFVLLLILTAAIFPRSEWGRAVSRIGQKTWTPAIKSGFKGLALLMIMSFILGAPELLPLMAGIDLSLFLQALVAGWALAAVIRFKSAKAFLCKAFSVVGNVLVRLRSARTAGRRTGSRRAGGPRVPPASDDEPALAGFFGRGAIANPRGLHNFRPILSV